MKKSVATKVASQGKTVDDEADRERQRGDSLRFEPREALARRRDGASLDARGRAQG